MFHILCVFSVCVCVCVCLRACCCLFLCVFACDYVELVVAVRGYSVFVKKARVFYMLAVIVCVCVCQCCFVCCCCLFLFAVCCVLLCGVCSFCFCGVVFVFVLFVYVFWGRVPFGGVFCS